MDSNLTKLKQENIRDRVGLSMTIKWVFVAIIIIVMLGAGIIIIDFQKQAEKSQQIEFLLAQVKVHVNQLNALEWQAIANKELDEELSEKVEKTQNYLKDTLNILMKYDPKEANLQQSYTNYEKYVKAIDEEFKLISEGQINQVFKVNNEIVDQSYEALSQSIEQANNIFEKLGRRTAIYGSLGVAFSALVAAVMLAGLFWMWEKSRRLTQQALKEQELLRQSEEYIKLAHQELEQIFNTATDGMRVIDMDFNVLKVNDVFSALCGKSKDEIVGQKCYEVFRGSMCNTPTCPIKQILNGAERIESDAVKERNDGTKIPCIVTATPFKNLEGELIGIVEDFKDITERKRIEDELQDSKNFSENLIQNSSVPTFVIDSNHKVIIWNKSCEDLTGINSKEIVGTESHGKVFYNKKRPCLSDIVINGENEELSYHYDVYEKSSIIHGGLHAEAWLPNMNGQRRYIVAESAPIFDEDGNLIAAIETLQDISNHKRGEEILYENEQIFRATFEQAAMGIVHADLNGHWMRVNQRFCDMIGYSSEETVSLNFKDITHPDDIEEDLENVERLKKGQMDNFALEKRYIRKDKSIVWVNLTVSLVREISGEPKYFIGIIEDISERKIAEYELQQKNRKMERELEMASEVQQELLPKQLPNTDKVKFAWEFWPSIYVAGDMFNIFQIDEDRVGFYILDVMGHGVQAALKAVTLNYLLKPSTYSDLNTVRSKEFVSLPSETLNFLNEKFGEETESSSFFTIFYGVLNTKSLELTFARAGHCAPIVVSNNSEAWELAQGGPAIGLSKDITYKDYTVKLSHGDMVFLYTDGIIEAKNPYGKAFSKERFIDIVSGNTEKNIARLISKTVDEVINHAQKQDLDDDVTLFGVKIL